MDFIQYLNDEFRARKLKNSKYSLRAYARDLQVESGFLSRILSKKLPLTPSMADRFLKNLKVPTVKAQKLRLQLQNSSERAAYVNEDMVKFLSNWYFYGIIAMFDLAKVQVNARSVSQVLGLSTAESQQALDILEEFGYVQREGSNYTQSYDFVTTFNIPGTNEYLRNFQKQVLKKAMEALDEIPVGLRSQSSLTFSIKRSKLPTVIKMIHSFRTRLKQYVAKNKKGADEIYNLSLSIYPVTQLHSESKKVRV